MTTMKRLRLRAATPNPPSGDWMQPPGTPSYVEVGDHDLYGLHTGELRATSRNYPGWELLL